MFYRNKRAQIPGTMTWLVVIFILFFCMAVFFANTSYQVSLKAMNSNDIDLIRGMGEGKIENTDRLLFLFESDVGEGKIKDLIYGWSEDEVEESVLEETLRSSIESLVGEKDYFFKVSGTSGSFDVSEGVRESRTRREAGLQGAGIRRDNPALELSGANINLSSANNQMGVLFYAKDE